MSTQYTQFTQVEREQLFMMNQAHLSKKDMAIRLGKHKSSIYRELARNRNGTLGYLPDRAHEKALCRKNHQKLKLNRHPDLKKHVIKKLKEGWSPEMISGRAKYEKFPVMVSPECIYQFIYGREGIELGLYKYLCMARPKRGKQYGRKPRGCILNRVSIHDRPKEIEGRKVFGHYEGDLIINQKSMSKNVAVVHERKTRFTRIMRNKSKKSSYVMQGIFNTLAQLPTKARKSITFDNGKEFARHSVLNIIEMETYFCDAYASWQKGGVENVNKMIRRFLPKKVPLKDVTDDALKNIEKRLNNLPRKCLGFRSAAEAFGDELVALQT